VTARFLLRYDTFSIAIPRCFGRVTIVFRLAGALMAKGGAVQYRVDPKSGNRISALGLGCMRFPGSPGHPDAKTADAIISHAVEQGINYLDTAYLYPGNEACVGASLERLGLRDRVLLATKLPHASCKCAEDFDRFFDEQLRRLRTDHIDYYLMHNITSPAQWERVVALGIEDWIAHQKAAGRIRQIGFSYHGSAADFLTMLDAYDWDFCQIQYNYAGERYQAGTAGLIAAAERGLAVFVMEPLLGGRLAGKLSGGMKQKLGLACTLVGEPKVLLLDEPGVGVDPISRRELWQMVHELAGEGMLILWSTSYLDEAEQCRDVLLMNEGELLYQGEPKALTQTMAGRSFLMTSPHEGNRKLLQRALKLPQVSDGMIQGKSVRLILKKEATPDDIRHADGMPEININETTPRFEDAFIDLLGGAGTSESPLGAILHTVEGTPGETVIEAKELTKKFGDFAATDHVNFAVKRGEIFGLLGPNGAGKSTTFKMMCGLLVPTSGQALVLGMDLKESSGKARQHLGYMAQKFSLYGNLTVEQNLRFFSGVYGLRGRAQNEKISRMSEAFGLKSIASHATDELPLGFKQRLALACSLMHEPDILFLDEPTSGVDPLTRREFWLHINSMVEKGVTVMVTTHFMDEAEYCDRIGLVYRGKLIASGTPDDLKAQSANDEQPDPTMEQAFIQLIHDWDKEHSNE
jgi:ABC-2 type transport system ATP-binding protein